MSDGKRSRRAGAGAALLAALCAAEAAAIVDPALYADAGAAADACRTLVDGRDDCLVDVAVVWGSITPCDGAAWPTTCIDAAGGRAVERCGEAPAGVQEACFTLAASELGAVSACDRVRPAERPGCLGSAAMARRDPAILTDRLVPGKERDLLLSAYALETLDEGIVPLLSNPLARQHLRTMMTLPLAIRNREPPPEGLCATIPSDYGGEYGADDAAADRAVCDRAVALAGSYLLLESDDARQAFIQALADQTARSEAEAAVREAAHDRYALYDQMGLERPDGGRHEPLPEGTLAFYTGQRNVVRLEVWNGSRRPLTQVGIEIEGERSWLVVDEVTPATLVVPPGEARDLALSFSVRPEAPEGAQQTVSVTAGAAEEADVILVDRFDLVIRRRAMTVRVDADGSPGAPQ